ncbi:MAG: tetratricopeptide repeat protein [Elusimicrobia bacterium]|nr:tetratricopeptide repeat protein [Elusimicrobiota bacterium]
MKNSFILIFTFYLLISNNLSAQTELAIQYINKAQELEKNGDIENAIGSLEDALAYDPANQQAKLLLVKILVKEGKNYYSRKNYDKALQFIKRASDLAPEINELKTTYENIKQAIEGSPVVAKEEIAPPKKEEPKKTTPAITPVTTPATKSEIQPTPQRPKSQDFDKMAQLLDSFKTSQEKWLETYKQSDELLNKKIQEFERTRIMYLLVMIIALLIGLSGSALYLISRFKSTKREQLLLEHKNHLLDIMEHKDLSFAKSITNLVKGQLFAEEEMSIKEMLVYPNAFIRARGVELLEEELKIQNDPVVAAKILLPFLRDPNNRVKANACKAMYDINPDIAVSTLTEMLDSSNRWMQSSASWALGEIGDIRSIEILLSKLDFLDMYSQKRAISSLHKILKYSKGKISDELHQKVNKKLMEISEKKEPAILDVSELLKEIPGEIAIDFSVLKNRQAVLHLRNGITLYRDAKYNEAILELKDCVHCNDKIWQVYEFLGDCYYAKRKISEAVRCYEKALELNPDASHIKELIEQRKSELI